MPCVQASLLRCIQAGEFESVLPGARTVKTLSDVPPLGIPGASDAVLKSYKPPINAADAANALVTTGMYEAGDSLFAVCAKPPRNAEDRAIAGIGACTPWSVVEEASARLEQAEVTAGDVTTCVGHAQVVVGRRRLPQVVRWSCIGRRRPS